ncbi:hypothetical protein [Hymenobacter koreensis]|uniref:Uncharacterized protein n=1 Tax=Hymenobacter koreensis TaxID=1084523 RepID=A0ABP8JJY8_9BACT
MPQTSTPTLFQMLATDTPTDAIHAERADFTTLSIAPRIIHKSGLDKSDEWRIGAAYAQNIYAIGLRKDGIVPNLLLQDRIERLFRAIDHKDGEIKELKRLLAESQDAEQKARKFALYGSTELAVAS